jgi:OB-fold nucleic acid binding protein
MGLFKRLGERLAAPPEQLRAQEIRKWCDEINDVEQIGICRSRHRARVAGIVQSIKVVPRDSSCSLEVQIYDGTDEVVGIWFGRRRIPGIELGRGLILKGVLGHYGRGPLTLINPEYELLPIEAD